jgi:hypothetical protein
MNRYLMFLVNISRLIEYDFCFFLLVHSTPGTNSLSPYLNFDPKILNPV